MKKDLIKKVATYSFVAITTLIIIGFGFWMYAVYYFSEVLVTK